jgi:hypothetical protein
MANAANAQGMVSNVTYVQNQNPNLVLSAIKVQASVMDKSGINLIAGCAQFMIVRAYHMNDQERWAVETSRDFLKRNLNELGLKQANSYRYIQTGLELARGIVKRHGLGGVMSDILTAKDERKAHDIIVRCIVEHGYLKPGVTGPTKPWPVDAEGKPRLSIDTLRVNLGLDTIPAPAAVNPADPLGANTGTQTSPGQGPQETVTATKAAPKTIIARLRQDKELVKSIPDEIVMAKADVIGREKMAERLVKLMTIDEIMLLQTCIAARLKELAEPAKETKAEEPAGETKTETKAEEPAGEVTERQPTRRNRRRATA